MLLVQFAQDMIPHFASLPWALEPVNLGHSLSQFNLGQFNLSHLSGWNWDLGSLTAPIQAQLQGQQFDTDVFRGTRGIFNNFIKTGQLWAFLFGLVVGYLLRALTTYG